MAYSYDLSSGDAATVRISKVRLLIPDNAEATAALQDDEITYFLTERGNVIKAAAADCCMWLARKYAQQASFAADGLRVEYGQRAQNYAERAKELRSGLDGGMGSVTMERADGFADEASDGEYDSRTVYLKV